MIMREVGRYVIKVQYLPRNNAIDIMILRYILLFQLDIPIILTVTYLFKAFS